MAETDSAPLRFGSMRPAPRDKGFRLWAREAARRALRALEARMRPAPEAQREAA